MLPGMSGPDIVKCLRASGSSQRNLPILGLTGNVDPIQLAAFSSSGATQVSGKGEAGRRQIDIVLQFARRHINYLQGSTSTADAAGAANGRG